MPAIRTTPTIRTIPYEPNNSRRDKRNTARRQEPLPLDLDAIQTTIDMAISHRMEGHERVHTEVMLEDNDIIIQYSRDNLDAYKSFYISKQYQAYYQMGYVLDVIADNMEIPDLNEANLRLGLSETEFKRGKRIFNFFKNWPLAIDHIGELSLSKWDRITDDQLEEILEEMKNKHRSDNNYFLSNFAIPGDLEYSSQSDTNEEFPIETNLNIDSPEMVVPDLELPIVALPFKEFSYEELPIKVLLNKELPFE